MEPASAPPGSWREICAQSTSSPAETANKFPRYPEFRRLMDHRAVFQRARSDQSPPWPNSPWPSALANQAPPLHARSTIQRSRSLRASVGNLREKSADLRQPAAVAGWTRASAEDPTALQ